MKYKKYQQTVIVEEVQNPNKPLIFGNNIVQGLGLLMFSYKTKTNQLESIVPVLTKNHTTLQKAITVNNQKMIWWYKAWNTLVNTAKKENKLDELKNEIETNLNTLKFKKGIWVVPYSAHPIVKQFFVKLKQDLKSNFKFILTDKETGETNVPQLNFALVIKKSIPLKIILQTLGEEQLEKHYKNIFKKDFDKSSGTIIDEILKKSSSDKSALDNIASYFGEENQLENLIITLFENQNIFSSSILSNKEDTEIPISHEDSSESGELQDDSTSTSEEIKPTEQEKNLNSEKNPDTNQEVTNAKIEENPKSVWQHRKENIEKERLKNQQVKEDENNQKSEFSADKFIEIGYVDEDEFEEKNKFIIEETLTKLIENTNDENKETELNEYKKIIRDYTNITNVIFNSFLRAYDVEKLLKLKVKGLSDIDLFSKKTPDYDLSNEKYLLDYKLITDVFSFKDFSKEDSALKAIDKIASDIEILHSIFLAADGFDHPLTVFRGVPATLKIRGNYEVFTDKWLRNPEHPLASDITGEFKRVLVEELNAGGNYDQIISKFYKINSSIETKSFLSTSISLHTASDFSLAYTETNTKYGHLFVINISKNQKVLYPGELSQYSTEGEIIIPFGSSLILKHIGFPQQYKNIKENHIITDLYSNIKDNKIDDNSIIFFLELDNKEPSYNKEEIDKYAIFWKNLYQMFFKK